ncbi:MAG: hypothetical protein KDD68_14260 [Bdellovibrionales bacterium]|nr:hypothetical protein [Bdellovibrionales bacterium]
MMEQRRAVFISYLIWAVIAIGLPSEGSANDTKSTFEIPKDMYKRIAVEPGVFAQALKLPIFKDSEESQFFANTAVQWKPDVQKEIQLRIIAVESVKVGGRQYPAGTRLSGEYFLYRLSPPEPVEINGIKICDHLGQHAQTLEIFEIKLCEDSEINGVKIPGGSKVAFMPHKTKVDQRWFDISCITPGNDMNYRGTAFKKGERIVALSDDFRPESPEDRMAECEVRVWDREVIKTLKRIGKIK